jgi:hypothetical protein
MQVIVYQTGVMDCGTDIHGIVGGGVGRKTVITAGHAMGKTMSLD